MTIISIKDEDHWKVLRKGMIGSSDIDCLMGSGQYQTAYELYQKIANGIEFDISSPLLEMGNAIEPIIAAMVCKYYDQIIRKCDKYFIHPKFRYLGASPDYEGVDANGDKFIAEIKNVISFSPGWTDERAPNYVEWQVQHQLLVCNAACESLGVEPYKYAVIDSLHAGNVEDIRVMKRYPDAKAHLKIIEIARKFMDDVRNSNEPPLTDSDYDMVRDFYLDQQVDQDVICTLKNMDSKINEMEINKGKIRELSKQIDLTKAEILNIMAKEKATFGISDSWSVKVSKINVSYKAKEAYESQQVRLSIKQVE